VSIRPLALAGWEDLSTWGYDEGVGSFYAQLTRNGHSDDDGPELWLTPLAIPVVRSPEELADIIARRTAVPLTDVLAAMRF